MSDQLRSALVIVLGQHKDDKRMQPLLALAEALPAGPNDMAIYKSIASRYFQDTQSSKEVADLQKRIFDLSDACEDLARRLRGR